MRIEVRRVGEVVNEAKYSYFELDYKKDGKAERPKKIVSFNDEYKILKDATEGQEFDVNLTKDDNGYWQWKDVRVAGEGATSASGGSKASATSNTTGKTGSWETPEERARRQILIVRQSCLAQAIAFSIQTNDPDNVLEKAGEFETWVNRE